MSNGTGPKKVKPANVEKPCPAGLPRRKHAFQDPLKTFLSWFLLYSSYLCFLKNCYPQSFRVRRPISEAKPLLALSTAPRKASNQNNLFEPAAWHREAKGSGSTCPKPLFACPSSECGTTPLHDHRPSTSTVRVHHCISAGLTWAWPYCWDLPRSSGNLNTRHVYSLLPQCSHHAPNRKHTWGVSPRERPWRSRGSTAWEEPPKPNLAEPKETLGWEGCKTMM